MTSRLTAWSPPSSSAPCRTLSSGCRKGGSVLKPGGRAYLLKQVSSRKRLLRWLMRRTDGFCRDMNGPNIDRDRVRNVETAGLWVVEARNLWGDIVKLVVAEKTTS